MPYYKWRGVDLKATIKVGTQFARTEQELDALLLERDISLITNKQVTLWIAKPIGIKQVTAFFEHFSSLIQTGVSIPQALRLVGERIGHGAFALIIQEMADSVMHGVSLTEAMNRFPQVFNPVMITTVNTGLETGHLPLAIDLLVDYLQAHTAVTKRMRTALIAPMITFGFFILIAGLLITVLVPRFAQLLSSLHRTLPAATQRLLEISAFFSSFNGMALLLGIFIISWGLWRYVKQYHKPLIDRIVLHIPFVRSLVITANAGAYFQSLGILVSGGMHMVPALHLAQQALYNSVIQQQFKAVVDDVASGYALSQALASHNHHMLEPDILSIIAVGEETGTMGPLLKKVAHEYYERLYSRLHYCTTLIQPLLMIALGLLITGFILAMYTPIFNFSYAV